MSASEPSEAAPDDGTEQDDVVEQPEKPELEHLESESEATALLRSDWKFAAIVQFCRMFASILRLKSFAADTLEAALLDPDNHRMFLSELVFKLLRADASQPYTEKDSEGWESLLYRKVSAKWPDQFDAHPLAGTTFFEISSTRRISLLFALCDWRVQDCAAVKDAIKRLAEAPDSSADLLRHEPIGEDSKGSLYYYFSFNNEDCRLYKQEPPSKRSGKRRRSSGEDDHWETVTTSVEDMAELVETLSASRSAKDRSLHDLISADILPKLRESAAARKRAEERQAAIEALPKKRSSRLQELTSKKEEEDRQKALATAERLARQKEVDRVRKEREREERLLARQREDERQADLQRKLAGIHPEGPSREERAQRRHRSSQAGSMSSDSGDMQAEHSMHSALSPSQFSSHQQEDDYPAATQHSHHRQQHQRRHQEQAMPRQARQQNPSPAQQAQQDADQAESSLPRLRPRSSRRRTYQESFAWSPLDMPVPQRRRTNLDSKPRKNMAGLVAAAKGNAHSYGRNRRGKWVLAGHPEEDLGQPAKPKPATRPRSNRASYVSPVAQPSSPAASWESGAAQQGRTRRQRRVSQDDFPEVPDRYSLQQWQEGSPPGPSQPSRDPSAWPPGPHLMWQQEQQQRQQQQVQQHQAATKAEFEEIFSQLTPAQRHALSKMPHDKRMQFFMNLKNQMNLAKQQQQQQRRQQSHQGMAWQTSGQQQQQMSNQGTAWQGSGQQQQQQQQLPSLAAHTQQVPMGGYPNQPSQQQQRQQEQYQHQLQQLTLSRLSPQQMQQLHALPVEHRAMQFGRFMRETQLQLQQQMQQQQVPSQGIQMQPGMSGYNPSMLNAQQQQLHQQQMQRQQHLQLQQQQLQQQQGQQQQQSQQPQRQASDNSMFAQGLGTQQALQQQSQAVRQQAGPSQGMPGANASFMQQSPYATNPQAQMVRPNSPPGLPRGPSGMLSQRNQIGSPSLPTSQPSGQIMAHSMGPTSPAAMPTGQMASGEGRAQSIGSGDLAFAQPSLPKQSSTGGSGNQLGNLRFVQPGMPTGTVPSSQLGPTNLSNQTVGLGQPRPSLPNQATQPDQATGLAGNDPHRQGSGPPTPSQAAASTSGQPSTQSAGQQQAMPGLQQQAMPGLQQQAMPGLQQQSRPGFYPSGMAGYGTQALQGNQQQMRSRQGMPGGLQQSISGLSQPSMAMSNSQRMMMQQRGMGMGQHLASMGLGQQAPSMGIGQQPTSMGMVQQATSMAWQYPNTGQLQPGTARQSTSPRFPAQQGSGAAPSSSAQGISPTAQTGQGSGAVPSSPSKGSSPSPRAQQSQPAAAQAALPRQGSGAVPSSPTAGQGSMPTSGAAPVGNPLTRQQQAGPASTMPRQQANFLEAGRQPNLMQATPGQQPSLLRFPPGQQPGLMGFLPGQQARPQGFIPGHQAAFLGAMPVQQTGPSSRKQAGAVSGQQAGAFSRGQAGGMSGQQAAALGAMPGQRFNTAGSLLGGMHRPGADSLASPALPHSQPDGPRPASATGLVAPGATPQPMLGAPPQQPTGRVNATLLSGNAQQRQQPSASSSAAGSCSAMPATQPSSSFFAASSSVALANGTSSQPSDPTAANDSTVSGRPGPTAQASALPAVPAHKSSVTKQPVNAEAGVPSQAANQDLDAPVNNAQSSQQHEGAAASATEVEWSASGNKHDDADQMAGQTQNNVGRDFADAVLT